jgi:ABC-2 type transport system permease protein
MRPIDTDRGQAAGPDRLPDMDPERAAADPDPGRHDALLPNAALVARREYLAQIRSRPFHISTLFLAALAVLVAFSPVFVRLADRGTTTTIAIQASDPQLARRSAEIMGGILNTTTGGGVESGPTFRFETVPLEVDLAGRVGEGAYDAGLRAIRDASGRIDFTFLTGQGLGADRAQLIGVGTLAVAFLDWTAANPTATPFQIPRLDTIAAAGPNTGGAPVSGAEFASRRILGIVFVILIFITTVIYGMWVAAGVVAEKTSRVMELLISAASARQLVIGKVAGIGMAGLTQYLGVLGPALLALAIEERVALAILGPGSSVELSLAALSPGLMAAYALFFLLGFTLYALIYAAAGSLVSRAEDLQMIALPMSIVAIAGYLVAVLALTGTTTGLIRFASWVPFWSPFVMLTRLAVGRVEPWELVLSIGLLLGAIVLVAVLAIRVYAAGVLLYGQRAGLRQVVSAVIRPAP